MDSLSAWLFLGSAVAAVSAPSHQLAELLGAVTHACAHRTSVSIDGAHGAPWRRRSVAPSSGLTSPGIRYFFSSMSWAAYGSDTAIRQIEP